MKIEWTRFYFSHFLEGSEEVLTRKHKRANQRPEMRVFLNHLLLY